ncbi:glycosyltransferase family 2 protein [Methanosphaera cuniculi]|uniref:Glycosyl transferase family 2 n=1 Tax=Methanosphaera cuniculi TaxID=1077256 RepID=A0A2A2HCM9_9EURY|nr:glycosyltransferase family 2 protein [Methanosphaera cuniculi]PAV07271.1 glycosyl transferase family 2 [Methanosphaera cuniculi]PWL08962.1 N-acetylglucosaminyl-diphospho-decaprenol L-rhamnosyltransferase [Methanosphaera cuniculi]
MDLSILIINYKTYELTHQTIQSVIDTVENIDYEVIIVDNNSEDGSLEQLIYDFKDYSNIKFIHNSANDGFAKANNIAFKNSKGKYILLLNSDVIVDKGTINETLNYLKTHKDVGAVGPHVRLPDGSLDKACRRSFPTPIVSFYKMTGLSKIFPNSPRFNKYNLSYMDEHEIYPVDCLVGAYMLMPRCVYESTGGLDEDYFMYGEDIDLCYKIKQEGYKIIYYGKTTITHFKGASGKNRRLLYEFHNSMRIFYDKHYKDEYNFITNNFIYMGIYASYYLKLLLSYLR